MGFEKAELTNRVHLGFHHHDDVGIVMACADESKLYYILIIKVYLITLSNAKRRKSKWLLSLFK